MWQLAQPNEYHPIKILHLQGQTHKQKKEGMNRIFIIIILEVRTVYRHRRV